MSFWSKVGAIALGVGGSFIPGVGPGLAIPAAAALWTGGEAADASKKAAATQGKAADEAMDLNRALYDEARGVQDRVYQQSQAAFAPFTALSGPSVGAIGGMLGLPLNMAAGTGAVSPAAAQAPGQSAAEMAVGRGGIGGTPQARARQQTASSFGTLGRAAGVVPLIAPDGSTRTVPAAQAQYYIARGARPLDPGDGGSPVTEVL